MISVDQALQELLKNVTPACGVERVPVQNALGRVLAEPAISPVNVPPADNSAMDGYAVAANAISTNTDYQISQRIAAGQAPSSLAKDTVARIFTGAEIPSGADAVIIQENAQATDSLVRFKTSPNLGDNIRRKGQDIQCGSVILQSGIRLRAQEIGLLASCGITHVLVYNRLKIALISTGDELVELGSELEPGQIYNSNRYMLLAFCQQAGMDVVDMGSVADNLNSTQEALSSAADKADIIITTGGVSVGDEDHAKTAVSNLGTLDLWKVAIKPGKPLAFGQIGETDFIGLPGNPSSVFTTFLILALPRLKAMQGIKETECLSIKLPALFNRNKIFRHEYLRARRTPEGIEIFPNQSSGVLSSACWGDGFAVQPAQSSISQNDLIEFIPYQNLF